MSKSVKIKWRGEPEKQDYPAARSYLSLHYPERIAKACVKKLKRAPMSEFKAKDIFRAYRSGGSGQVEGAGGVFA